MFSEVWDYSNTRLVWISAVSSLYPEWGAGVGRGCENVRGAQEIQVVGPTIDIGTDFLGPVQMPYFTWAESNSNLGRPKLI